MRSLSCSRDRQRIQWGTMQVTDVPFRGAADLLRRDQEVDHGYRSLLRVLMETTVPRQTRTKASPRYIYDQTQLQKNIRAQLVGVGWTHGRALSADLTYDRVTFTGIRADLLGDGCHVILEFGNRASWAHNLVTRGVGANSLGLARLLVFVAPSTSMADQIDANLASFEAYCRDAGAHRTLGSSEPCLSHHRRRSRPRCSWIA